MYAHLLLLYIVLLRTLFSLDSYVDLSIVVRPCTCLHGLQEPVQEPTPDPTPEPEQEPEPTPEPEEPGELIDVEQEIGSTWTAEAFTGPTKDSLGNQTRVGLLVWAYQKGAPVSLNSVHPIVLGWHV